MELTSAHLFCGAGGDTEGSFNAGFRPIWAVENDKYAAAVYRCRFPQTLLIEGDIQQLSDDYIKTLTTPAIIIGGSPCKNFSLCGDRSGLSGDSGKLFFEYCRFLRLLNPPMFLWENVRGAISSGASQDFKEIIGNFSQLGYMGFWHTSPGNFAQSRKRVFVLGLHRRYEGFTLPQFGLEPDNWVEGELSL